MSSRQSSSSTTLCRYFATGGCSMGDSCWYSHDRSHQEDMTCRFYLKGSCEYGTACRYNHERPKQGKIAKTKKPSSLPKPAQLAPPGLNPAAAEFVPSWKKAQPGSSYSAAAGGSSSDVDLLSADQTMIPLCPYFEMDGEVGCTQENCTFVHGSFCDMCSRYCLHPFDPEQQKKHTEECTFNHAQAMEEAFLEARSADKQCGICMENIREKSLRFGILEGCRHCFCLNCIREWRMKQGYENTVTRSCPECRQHSNYVVPSLFWVEDSDEKELLLQVYKENTKEKQCKYYLNRNSNAGCPFGNKCFYKHQLPDGSLDPGEEPHVRRKPQLSEFLFRDLEEELSDSDDEDSEGDILEQIRAALAELRGRPL